MNSITSFTNKYKPSVIKNLFLLLSKWNKYYRENNVFFNVKRQKEIKLLSLKSFNLVF